MRFIIKAKPIFIAQIIVDTPISIGEPIRIGGTIETGYPITNTGIGIVLTGGPGSLLIATF